MKIILPNIQEPLDCGREKCCSLIVENQPVLYHILCDITHQLQGEDGTSVLSEANKTLSIQKCVELHTQFIPFEINQKNLLSKVQGQMHQIAVDESHYMETQELLSNWERYLMDISMDLIGNLQFGKIQVDSLIKGAGVLFDENDGV